MMSVAKYRLMAAEEHHALGERENREKRRNNRKHAQKLDINEK